MLSGKYLKGIPEDSRANTLPRGKALCYDPFFKGDKAQNTIRILNGLQKVAEELGSTMARLAVAWTLVYKHVSTAIIGASKPEQIIDNCQAIALLPKLTPEVLEKIEAIVKNRPKAPRNIKAGFTARLTPVR